MKYNSPSITAQSKRDGYFISDFAVKKSMFKDHWHATIAWSNIFDSWNYDSVSSGDQFYIKDHSDFKSYASFKLAYTFDNQK